MKEDRTIALLSNGKRASPRKCSFLCRWGLQFTLWLIPSVERSSDRRRSIYHKPLCHCLIFGFFSLETWLSYVHSVTTRVLLRIKQLITLLIQILKFWIVHFWTQRFILWNFLPFSSQNQQHNSAFSLVLFP